MKYQWFISDRSDTQSYMIYRLISEELYGERWDTELRSWVFSEKPVRYIIGKSEWIDEISFDEARALLPSEAIPEWRGQRLFKLFSFEIVRLREVQVYHWGVPKYEAKDPNPEPLHALRIKHPIRKFSVWQSWDLKELRWITDWKATFTRKYKGCEIYFIGNALVRDILPRKAFDDLHRWKIRVSQKSRPANRLVGIWQSKTPPSS